MDGGQGGARNRHEAEKEKKARSLRALSPCLRTLQTVASGL